MASPNKKKLREQLKSLPKPRTHFRSSSQLRRSIEVKSNHPQTKNAMNVERYSTKEENEFGLTNDSLGNEQAVLISNRDPLASPLKKKQGSSKRYERVEAKAFDSTTAPQKLGLLRNIRIKGNDFSQEVV